MNLLPQTEAFRKELLRSLGGPIKSISPKFLYDERGSEIFEEICKLDEYYLIHAEKEILGKYSDEISEQLGENSILIEPGCGNCEKVQFLLNGSNPPKAYIGLDISKEFLEKATHRLQEIFPKVKVYSVVADYTYDFNLPTEVENLDSKRVIFFPGSTIGNLEPKDAQNLLCRLGKKLRPSGGLLIGVDTKKDAQVLELAYDDSKGVTAEFNYNLLDRLNREFAGNFDRKNFEYEAHYNHGLGRVEMFLVSRKKHSVQFGNANIKLKKKELIHTENSYKYTPDEFIRLAENCGYIYQKSWTDAQGHFCVYYFNKSERRGDLPE